MKHLEILRTFFSKKLNESNSIHDGIVEDAITVDGIKIDLRYNIDCDDDYIIYDLGIPGKEFFKLAKIGVFFDDFDYSEIKDNDLAIIYQTNVTVSERTLGKYGAYQTSDLDADDVFDIIENKIKFKFDKKYTAKEFVKFINDSDIYGHDITASLKSSDEINNELKTAEKQKALSMFLGSLTQKDYYFLGKDENYFEELAKFKSLKKFNISKEEAVKFCLNAIGVKDFEKSNKIRKFNSKTGLLD